MGLDDYVILYSDSIYWNYNRANNYGSEWSYSDVSQGRGLMDLNYSVGSMWDPHQVLAQDLCFFLRRNLKISLI